MPEGVRLQNLRDFTVQIRNVADKIVGTGIAVSMDGKVVTCRHVIEAAVGKAIDGAEVGIYFPQARGSEEKKRRAKLAGFFAQHDDDMVLLELFDGASPLAPEQIAVLGMADYSEGNPFRTYGYSPIGNYPATRGEGTILGTIEPPLDKNLQADPVELKSRDIAAGMSGAAVLDVNRNLVVGLVAERFYSPGLVQDDIGYGVDSKVLTFSPFDFILSKDDLALKPAPEFKLDKDWLAQAIEIGNYALAHRKADEKYSWNSAPAVLPEWTGRYDLLAQLTTDWLDPQKHVAGLIGFGGEGKSSLARKWVDDIGRGDSRIAPTTGIFWWGFYENRSVDEFLEAALKYLGGGRIDPKAVPSSSLRAQIIGAMLGAGKYLFVLDGLEVLQHQEGDQYGLLQNNDLRDLLTYFARPDNQSFCLVTSRAPLLDLMDYTTYSHHDVDRLSEADGVALLKKLGVKPSSTGGPTGVLHKGQGEGGAGGEGELAKIISDWDGHALTVSLLGSYLAEKHGGDLAHLAELPVPTADEPRYERVHRVLRRYDEHLSEIEREFLKLFSAFRTPVQAAAFEKVFVPLLNLTAENAHRPDVPTGESAEKSEKGSQKGFFSRIFGSRTDKPHPEPQITKSSNHEITQLVARLVHYRLLRHDPHEDAYTTHPLIRNHYFALFTKSSAAQEKVAHEQIKDYYLSIAGDTPTYPSLDNLKPLIEVVHHACQAGAYDEAWKILWERIYQQEKYVIAHQLSAYDTALNILYEFFEKDDLSREPKLSNSGNQRWILNSIGHHLMSLGRLREAVPFYERKNKIALEMQDWSNLSNGYQNLADLHASLGALDESAAAARQALDLARRAENKQDERNSLVFQGWVSHLLGDLQTASDAFAQAEKFEQKIDSNERYLYGLRGIHHADHLRCIGNSEYARRVNDANLKSCEEYHWVFNLSQCHRVLGDLDADAGNHNSARAHYDAALKLARGISHRPALIEALLARGRFFAKIAVGATRPAQTGAASGEAPRQNGTTDGPDGSPLPLAEAFNDLNDPSTSSPVPAAHRPAFGAGPAQAGQAPISDAFNDLQEAWTYALEGGYRIYEADIRVALGWAWLASEQSAGAGNRQYPSGTMSKIPSGHDVENLKSAKAEATRALEMSREMGYYWGKVDAEEVLARLAS